MIWDRFVTLKFGQFKTKNKNKKNKKAVIEILNVRQCNNLHAPVEQNEAANNNAKRSNRISTPDPM